MPILSAFDLRYESAAMADSLITSPSCPEIVSFPFPRLKLDSTKRILVTKNITIKQYFNYLDSLVKTINNKGNKGLTEHILVRYNPWIIDSLRNTDYYTMMERDSFVYNQKELIALKKGSQILIPDSLEIENIIETFNRTILDINIPEYRLRIYHLP